MSADEPMNDPRTREGAFAILRSASFPTRLVLMVLVIFAFYVPTIWLHWPYMVGWFVGALVVGLVKWVQRAD